MIYIMFFLNRAGLFNGIRSDFLGFLGDLTDVHGDSPGVDGIYMIFSRGFTGG